ncbi:MAG: helix-turn-helix transcriptional regulator [Actinocrinis sp.]
MPALAPDAVVEDKVGTRNRVARLILANGPSTAADLAARLGLTPAGVRRHLDALLAEGLVEAREQRVYGHRGRGRPAKVFALTGDGRSVFHHTYDDMAIDALRFIAQNGGDAAVDAFARRRFTGLAERYRATLAAADPGDRPRVLAEVLTADGYAASTRSTAAVAVQDSAKSPIQGAQVCQHHCPVQHVAEEFPQLCEAETQVFAELLGTHVQRLATIAHGDGVCTTFIPGFISTAAVSAGRAAAADADFEDTEDTEADTETAAGTDRAAHTDFTTNAQQSEGA